MRIRTYICEVNPYDRSRKVEGTQGIPLSCGKLGAMVIGSMGYFTYLYKWLASILGWNHPLILTSKGTSKHWTPFCWSPRGWDFWICPPEVLSVSVYTPSAYNLLGNLIWFRKIKCLDQVVIEEIPSEHRPQKKMGNFQLIPFWGGWPSILWVESSKIWVIWVLGCCK